MRVGIDVTPSWSNDLLSRLLADDNLLSAKHALRNIMTRAFIQNALWLNDPDCFMIRRRQSKLTEDEVKSMASVYAITGGLILISDDMSLVDADRIDLARRTLELRTRGCRVPDLMRSPFPEEAVAKTKQGVMILSANWEDKPRQKEVDLSRMASGDIPTAAQSVIDVWTGEQFPIINQHIDLGVIPPHGSRLLEIVATQAASLSNLEKNGG